MSHNKANQKGPLTRRFALFQRPLLAALCITKEVMLSEEFKSIHFKSGELNMSKPETLYFELAGEEAELVQVDEMVKDHLLWSESGNGFRKIFTNLLAGGERDTPYEAVIWFDSITQHKVVPVGVRVGLGRMF
ncbi:hypothetical protein [Amphritea sp. HPY]|uniref:hypothetical protein n=1 Tax=Amphritea sp. HPY TaxID=3421652 RepID=UPI003D7EE59B